MAADLERLWPPFREKIKALLHDPEAKDLGVWVVSGFRSDELQAALFKDAVRRYGTEAKARRWVAPPGRSRHGPRVNADGKFVANGEYGVAVDFGVRGTLAVQGKWPELVNRRMVALAHRYEMHSPLEWEDWHHEPMASMFTRAHDIPQPAVTDQEEDMAKAMVVVDLKTAADPEGRLPNWEVDENGNVENWNGARQLRSLAAFDPRFAGKDHPKIVDVEREPGGDGVVMFADDGFQLPDGRWVRSTYKITVGM